jgi:hypothetical protein
MDDEIREFCKMIRGRSTENRQAMQCFLAPHSVLSPAFSILRQELDSMVRVIFLLSIKNMNERKRLIEYTLRGDKWRIKTKNGTLKNVFDKDMVDLAQRLHGWTQSVYRFGCAFVHLSDLHNHLAQHPFAKLSKSERGDILSHMRSYHGGPSRDDPDVQELSEYIPRIFDKIAKNLECHLKDLEQGKAIDP